MYNYVGKKIKQLLTDENKTVAELAAQSGIPYAVLSKVINGNVKISADMAIRLGKVFGNQEDLADMVTEYESSNVNAANMWLWYQYKSDIANVKELDGPMYRNITPFE